MVFWVNSDREWWCQKLDVINTMAMFFLQGKTTVGIWSFWLSASGVTAGGWSWWFCLGAIIRTVELGWEASLEMGGCSILLGGIPSSSSRCPQENGRCPAPWWWENLFYTFNYSSGFHTGTGRKSVQFSHSVGAVFHFLGKDIHSISRFSHLELKCCLF